MISRGIQTDISSYKYLLRLKFELERIDDSKHGQV